jgi:hypothetical protein
MLSSRDIIFSGSLSTIYVDEVDFGYLAKDGPSNSESYADLGLASGASQSPHLSDQRGPLLSALAHGVLGYRGELDSELPCYPVDAAG